MKDGARVGACMPSLSRQPAGGRARPLRRLRLAAIDQSFALCQADIQTARASPTLRLHFADLICTGELVVELSSIPASQDIEIRSGQ
jgi:hypothetical protein